MPRIVNPPHELPRLEPAPNRKRFTRSECEFLVRSDILTGRYELIDGDIISKKGQKPPHATAISLVFEHLRQLFGEFRVRCQGPIEVIEDDKEVNEPEPDFAVLIAEASAFASRHPGPSEVLLIVEVSDTSLRFDLQTKAALYARSAIPDYWVLDITGRAIRIHRDPKDGEYRTIIIRRDDELASPLAKPELSIPVADLLPPK